MTRLQNLHNNIIHVLITLVLFSFLNDALFDLKSLTVSQFPSQSVVNINDPQWQNALDIIIPSLSISAHSKELFVNTELSIVHGRRYGLVGPNGAGKSTLLKMISSGELKVPPRVDYLYVEQEVLADETPAVDAVLKADKYVILSFLFLYIS